jgi:hypothetical protein
MTAREAKRQYRLKEWANMIEDRGQSGLTIRAWCSQNEISIRSYYYWLKQVREYAAMSMTSENGKSNQLSEQNCEVMAINSSGQLPVPRGWTMCSGKTDTDRDLSVVSAKVLAIEIGKCRVIANMEIDSGLLAKVCKVLVSLC